MELFDQFISADVLGRLPTVVGFGVPFPSDQVLVLIVASSDIKDLIHFPFFLSINQFWWQISEIGAVFFCLFEWGKE